MFRTGDRMNSTELTVRQVMQPEPVCVPPDTPIREAMRLMNRQRIGAILVVRDSKQLVGIFTERDLLKRVIPAIPGWRDYPVSDWMSSDPYTISPDVGWNEAVGIMTRFRVRHLPVIEDQRLIGIISARALMNRRTEYLDHKIDESTRELRSANDQLLARDAESAYNLRAAGQLQTTLLLPHPRPNWPEFDWGVHYAPLDHLGGDYYDFATPDADHLGFLIADASGHSLPAAMVAIMARIAFAEVANRTIHPGEVLGEMNLRLQALSGERFVTAFYGVFNRKSRTLHYASAGHPHPLLIDRANGTVHPLVSQGFLLGVMPGEIYFEKRIDIRSGDRICFYTDGVIEARNAIGELYGTERLVECLQKLGGSDTETIVEGIRTDLRKFCDGQLFTDDVTFVVAAFDDKSST